MHSFTHPSHQSDELGTPAVVLGTPVRTGSAQELKGWLFSDEYMGGQEPVLPASQPPRKGLAMVAVAGGQVRC